MSAHISQAPCEKTNWKKISHNELIWCDKNTKNREYKNRYWLCV